MEYQSGAIRLSKFASGNSALDASLVSRCKHRDAEAFTLLVDRYQARVYGYVRRMLRSIEDAEDVSQEVFIKAFQNIDSFDSRASFSTWLFKIASNLCIDKLRKQEKENRVGFESLELDGTVSFDKSWDPEASLNAKELAIAIEKSITQLSNKLKPVLLLHDQQNLGYEEIAEILSIPVGTVKSRLFLAREELKKTVKTFYRSEDVL